MFENEVNYRLAKVLLANLAQFGLINKRETEAVCKALIEHYNPEFQSAEDTSLMPGEGHTVGVPKQTTNYAPVKERVGAVAEWDDAVCEYCGNGIKQIPKRKKKRFCSNECRNKWWNSHLDLVKRRAVYKYECQTCGKEFEIYGNSHRKFCCHDCYVAYRFKGGADNVTE